MTLLGWLWIGQWRASTGRTMTAIAAIAIGVALALAIHLVNRSALGEFAQAISVVNGDAQLQLRGAANGFDENLYPEIAMAAGVLAASPVIETTVLLRKAADSQPDAPRSDPNQWQSEAKSVQLRLLGIDVMRAAEATPALLPRVDEGSPNQGSSSDLFADDAIFLSASAMQALGVDAGQRVVLTSGLTQLGLRVAGSVPDAGQQALAVMDLGAAQWKLGWLGRLSRIDLRLARGTDSAHWARQMQATLPDGIRVLSPDASAQRMSNLSRAYRVNLNVLALVALFTGGFIVYATMSLAATRQLPQIALIGVLGASRRLMFAVIAGQGLALGLLGALLGVAGGYALAALLLALLGGDLGGGYFQGVRPALAIEATAALGFGTLGSLVGLLGGALAARKLARMEPARALKAAALDHRLNSRQALLISGLLFGCGALLLAAPSVYELPIPAYLAIVCWLLAGIAFVPVLIATLGKLLQQSSLAWRNPAGWLALQRITGAPGTAATALSGVVASVALASAMAIMVHSFRTSVDHWLDVVLPADVYGRAPGGPADGALMPALQGALADIEGIQQADFLRIVELELDPKRPPVTLLARDLDQDNPSRQLPMTGRALKAPAGSLPVYVSEAMLDLYGFKPGETISLPLPDAATKPRLFVAGVWRDYARQHGTITIDRQHWQQLTGDRSANNVALRLTPDQTPEKIIALIQSQLPEARALEFSSSREIRQLSLQIFDRSFALTYVLEAIAIVVGLFGVAATYAGEALARAREFGMLRHLGLTRRAIMQMFGFESALLLVTGIAWGAMLGIAIALVLVHRVNPQSFHWTMDVAWPMPLLAASMLSLLILGVASAVLASRSATGRGPVQAIREDW